jgi:disulfide bond formation protein DsbB
MAGPLVPDSFWRSRNKWYVALGALYLVAVVGVMLLYVCGTRYISTRTALVIIGVLASGAPAYFYWHLAGEFHDWLYERYPLREPPAIPSTAPDRTQQLEDFKLRTDADDAKRKKEWEDFTSQIAAGKAFWASLLAVYAAIVLSGKPDTFNAADQTQAREVQPASKPAP